MKMNSLLIAALILTISLTTRAQDWAKAKLDKSPRHGEWVMLTHDGRQNRVRRSRA